MLATLGPGSQAVHLLHTSPYQCVTELATTITNPSRVNLGDSGFKQGKPSKRSVYFRERIDWQPKSLLPSPATPFTTSAIAARLTPLSLQADEYSPDVDDIVDAARQLDIDIELHASLGHVPLSNTNSGVTVNP